jgi:hypothetical protein
MTHWDFPTKELLEQPDYESALEGRGLRY